MRAILVYSATKAEHDKHLEQTLETPTKSRLTFQKSKCSFGVIEILFYGCFVNKDEVESDPQKMAAMEDLEAPYNVANVLSLLSMANNLARFVPNQFEKSTPSRQLLQKARE